MLDLQRIDGEKRKETVSKLRRDMAEMMLCQIDGSPESRLSFDASFYHLMNTIIAAAPPLRMHKSAVWTNQKKQQAIMEMVKYIDRNYREKITLEILAREAGYNPSYVSQLFKSCMGINFFEYLTRVRLREATLALSCSEKKILDIALEHGFSDLKSFNFTFKNTFRKSPAEYRRQLNREHLGNDAVFKKSFITADDPRAMEKILAYREGKNTKDLRTPGHRILQNLAVGPEKWPVCWKKRPADWQRRLFGFETMAGKRHEKQNKHLPKSKKIPQGKSLDCLKCFFGKRSPFFYEKTGFFCFIGQKRPQMCLEGFV